MKNALFALILKKLWLSWKVMDADPAFDHFLGQDYSSLCYAPERYLITIRVPILSCPGFCNDQLCLMVVDCFPGNPKEG